MVLHNDSLITSTLSFMFAVENCTVCVRTCEKRDKNEIKDSQVCF
jgi:hypothetical protein